MKRTVIYKTTYWWFRVRSNLDEINSRRPRQVESLTNQHDAKLLTLLSNDAHFGRANLPVYAKAAQLGLPWHTVQNVNEVFATGR